MLLFVTLTVRDVANQKIQFSVILMGAADVWLYCHPSSYSDRVFNAHWWDSLRLAPTLVGGYMRGGQEGGILHSIRWSHLLSPARDGFSFMKFTHSITRRMDRLTSQRRQPSQWGNIQVRSLPDIKVPLSIMKTLFRMSVGCLLYSVTSW